MSHLIIKHIDSIAKTKYKILPWLICGVGAIFYWYEYLLRIAPSVMSAELMGQYHLSAWQFGDLNAYYYYAYTPMQLIVGLLMDRYGPRRLLMLACLASVAGAFIFAHSEILILAKCSRFLIGFGSAFAFVGALKLATIWLPPERFASVAGMVNTLGMLGAMFGDVVMSHFVVVKGWRPTLVLSAWGGVVLVVLIWMIVHDRVKTKQDINKIPYVPDVNFKHVFLGLLESLKNPFIWINGMVGCFLYLSLAGFAEVWGIHYLEQVHRLSHFQAAWANAMVFLGWAIGAPLGGWLSDRLRRRRLPVTLGALFAACFILIILYVPSLSVSSLYLLLLLFGVACGVEVIVFAVGKEISPKHIAGTAISVTNMFTMISGTLLQPLMAFLLGLGWSGSVVDGVRVYSVGNYQLGLSVLPIGLLIAVVLSLMLKETHGHDISSFSK